MGLGVWGTIVGKGVGSAYAVAGVVCFLLLFLCVCEGCLCFFMFIRNRTTNCSF
jgi:hypothetical protein